MDCSTYRSALSARTDGEDPGMADDVLQRHLDECAACRRWPDDVLALEATLALRPAAPVPEISSAALARIAAALAPAPTTSPAPPAPAPTQRLWRLALSLVAVAQLGVAVPSMALGGHEGGSTHVIHELGSWEVALAIGFLFAAWRPSRAFGMLPLVTALVVCLVAMTVTGMGAGDASGMRETSHALQLASLPLLWVLARHSRPEAASRRLA